MIKNIIFDIGNVLISFHPVKVMQDMNYPEDAVNAIADATIRGRNWFQLDLGIMPEDEVIRLMRKDAPGYEELYDRFFIEGKDKLVSLYDYSMQWIKDLKFRGYHVYLLSNYPDTYFDLHSSLAMPFVDIVDGMVISAKVKMIKPNPDIYQHLLNKYDLAADECVFIDDTPANVQTALDLGIHALHFEGYETTRQQLNDLLKQ